MPSQGPTNCGAVVTPNDLSLGSLASGRGSFEDNPTLSLSLRTFSITLEISRGAKRRRAEAPGRGTASHSEQTSTPGGGGFLRSRSNDAKLPQMSSRAYFGCRVMKLMIWARTVSTCMSRDPLTRVPCRFAHLPRRTCEPHEPTVSTCRSRYQATVVVCCD